VPFFALKYVVNYPQVKLYQESELGWMAMNESSLLDI